MSGYADEAQTIRARWESDWVETDTAWPNAAFTPTPGTEWVRLSILTTESEQITTGAARDYRHPGLVVVQVFAPKNSGDGRARELAEAACGIFRAVTVDNLVFGSPWVEQGDDRDWYVLNVNCPYYRDDQF